MDASGAGEGLGGFNRKDRCPSQSMHPPDGHRYRCSWIEDSITVHSDGNVTCGLDDPHGQRSFGNINSQPVPYIMANPEYGRLRRRLWAGQRCRGCNLYQRVSGGPAEEMPQRPAMPSILVVEPTVRCNLRCPQQACIANNDPAIRTRNGDFLDLPAFRRMVDDIGPGLRHVYFFNYGDPFVHAGAEEMLAHLSQVSGEAQVVTSTNGIPLAKMERARKVVAAGLGMIVFTIGGITQESYSRYHVSGRVDLALRGLRNVIEAKRELGAARPYVLWRYLAFPWNDSVEEVEAAIRLSQEYGVDEFSLYLTHFPEGGESFRFSPGSPNFVCFRPYIASSLGYTHAMPTPDDDGLYGLETTPLGPGRWTSWQARRRVPVRHGRASLAVTTSRPLAHERTNHVFVITPGRTIKVPLDPMAWRHVELPVPAGTPDGGLEVELVTFDHWFPAEELGNRDLRCLGVLLREDGEEAHPGPRWSGDIPVTPEEEERLSRFRYAVPMPLVDDNAGRLQSFEAAR